MYEREKINNAYEKERQKLNKSSGISRNEAKRDAERDEKSNIS